jgi:molybdenum cofactor cytidylyltransferase
MIEAIVLAAGRSRRMGTPKALLAVGGVPQIERTVGALREGGCDRVTVVVRRSDGADARRVAEAAARVADRVVEVGEGEQIDSLRAALRTTRPEVRAVVVAPVDVPGLTGRTVAALIDRGRAGDAAVVVPVAAGVRGHPVLFARSVFPELLDEGLTGGARTVVRAHESDTAEVDVGDPARISDADTPREWRRLSGLAESTEGG